MRRLGRFFDRVEARLFEWGVGLYIAAASLIGLDAFVIAIGYMTIWPVGIPILLMSVGAFALVRARVLAVGRRAATRTAPPRSRSPRLRRPVRVSARARHPRTRGARGSRPGRRRRAAPGGRSAPGRRAAPPAGGTVSRPVGAAPRPPVR